jgi:hypothetical protein
MILKLTESIQKLVLEGIECMEYDYHLATMIQRGMRDDNI